MSGFITMERDALDHPLLQDAERFRAWFYMVARACWKPTRFDVGGKIITLQRGQFCCSVRELAVAWGWSKSAVDRFLTRLKTDTMIGTDTGTGRLVITICNYAKYQDRGDAAGTGVGTATGTAAGQQRDLKEQGNKGTIEEEPYGSPSSAGGAGEDLFGGELDGGGKPPAKPKPTKGKREPAGEIPMPENWEPVLTAKAQRIVDGWPPGMLDREVMAFEGHASANGRMTKDWQAAFRTWIAKAEERRTANDRSQNNRGGAASGYQSRQPASDGFAAATHRRIAEARSREAAAAAGRSDFGDDEEFGDLPNTADADLR